MSCKTTSLLAAFLEDSEDTAGILDLIRAKWPRSMATYLTQIRKHWLTLNKACPQYRAGMDALLEQARGWQREARTKAEEDAVSAAIAKLQAFDGMTMTEKYAVHRGLRVRGFTGDLRCDAQLQKLAILPPYVANLKLDPAERLQQQQAAASALQAKSSASFEVNASQVLSTARALLAAPRSNLFDLACALSLVTGRRMVEIFRTGAFAPLPGADEWVCEFSGQAKKHATESSVPYRIPLLAPLPAIQSALQRLRCSKATSDMLNAEVNARYSTSCNTAARRLLGRERRFHDCRAIYGVVSYHVALPHTYSLNMWLCKVLGHASLTNSLNYSALHVTGLQAADLRAFSFS